SGTREIAEKDLRVFFGDLREIPEEKSIMDDICLITGSGGGIGKHFALEFAKKGAILVLWDSDPECNEETAKEVRRLGARAFTYTCDTGDRQQVYQVAERVRREVGDVTILLNHPSTGTGKSLLHCQDEELENALRTNCLANFWVIKAFLPRMNQMNHGHVINVASYLGLFATANMEDYCTAHFATVGFHEALSHELKARRISGVKTTLLCPYLADIEMKDLATLFTPLTSEYFARRAINGILTDQPMICMPKLLYLAAFLKQLSTFSYLRDQVQTGISE
uniref:Short-chain dehydrogenase/reductase 3 n=1 Tax=Xenopus tropicalis TaxID=8364 RepID=A0A6I8QPU3_XENTR